MIESITGALVAVEPTAVVVDLHGLAVRVEVPPSTAERAGPIGGRVTLLTQLVIGGNDPTPRLFGFASPTSRALFRALTSVSQIGPSIALRVLAAHHDPGEIAAAIARGDEDAIRVKGVGPKIAKRIVTELRDAMGGLSEQAAAPATAGVTPGSAGSPATGDRALDDAFRALKGLEFEPDEARRLLKDARASLPASATADELVRAVLLRM